MVHIPGTSLSRAVLGALVLLALASCSVVQNPMVAYVPPATTPYAQKPHLEAQYLLAHKAGWRNVVLAFPPGYLQRAASECFWSSSSTTCDEATQNVTAGWYKGQEDAEQFLHKLAGAAAHDPTIVPAYRALHKKLKANSVTDWYTFDGYNPSKVVKEVVSDGNRRTETTYYDATKRTVFMVERYRGDALDGDSEQYDANGELSLVTPYKDGLIDGVQRGYSDTGALTGEVR